jgi:hypothetical protein
VIGKSLVLYFEKPAAPPVVVDTDAIVRPTRVREVTAA